jgi:hypothetical protein
VNRMDNEAITESLRRATSALDRGEDLAGTRFWKVVTLLRRDPAAADRYADDIAKIDRRAFEAAVKLRVPAGIGHVAMLGATAIAIVAIAIAGRFPKTPRTLVFLAAFGALELSTHTLAHFIVGRLMGIRFTHYFLGGPPPPRPGLKTDYATYLRTAPRKRAIMHASGAVVTKILPFALIPAALALSVHRWAVWLLAGVGVFQIVTDILFSTKTSDWMKVKRELKASRGAP